MQPYVTYTILFLIKMTKMIDETRYINLGLGKTHYKNKIQFVNLTPIIQYKYEKFECLQDCFAIMRPGKCCFLIIFNTSCFNIWILAYYY